MVHGRVGPRRRESRSWVGRSVRRRDPGHEGQSTPRQGNDIRGRRNRSVPEGVRCEGTEKPTLILTDSITTVEAVTSTSGRPTSTAANELQKLKGCRVIGWIKGHAEIPGNDTADEEAKVAATEGPRKRK